MEHARTPPRQEFERKFLVIKSALPKRLPKATRIVQGYLATAPTQIRIRVKNGTDAVLQIKGPRNFESSELSVPLLEAGYLLKSHLERGTGLVDKDRHVLPSAWKGLKWELDVFRGRHRGLLIAEIELPREGFRLDPAKFPAWVGKEVTSDKRYANRHLARR